MLASKLLVALFALPLAALAQDTATGAAPANTDAAPADASASDAPAETGAASATESKSAAPTKSKSVGADISNTGNGQSSNSSNWRDVQFTAPSQDYYWVLNVENTAVFTAYEEPINLVLFNSNNTIFTGNKTIAENLAAGTTTWTGKIEGLNPGNNYIIAAAPVSNPNRKVGQTRGFWIKRAGTVTMPAPTGAANSTTSTATGNSTNADANATQSAGNSSNTITPPATTPSSGADKLAMSAAGVFGALALALSL